MSGRKLLFVDDEPSIRLTLPAILRMHGYEVTSAGTVPEALQAIQMQTFDVLVTDLNIGQPGDGFTVVSAMRRTQPEAVTIILTGYPAFETALEAIRSQVDDYIVKPANVEILVGLIERKLVDEQRMAHRIPERELSELMEESVALVSARWLREMKRIPEFVRLGLDGAEQCKSVESTVHGVTAMLKGHGLASRAAADAREYGVCRSRQGASLSLLMQESRVLRRVILSVVQENLLSVNLSQVIHQMIDICEWLDAMAAEAVDAYTERWKAPKAG